MSDKLTLEELKPVLDLIGASEERVTKKIDSLHSDVRRINGNVARHEIAINAIQLNCQAIQTIKSIQKASDTEIKDLTAPDLKKVRTMANIFTWFGKRPRITFAIILITILTTQSLVMCAVQHEWISLIWKYIFK